MGSTLGRLGALLLSTAILIAGNGLITTLLPVRAEIEGFGTFQTGALGAAYFVGFVAGCVVGPRMIGRVGHIRAFASLSSIAAAATLAHALLLDPVAWWLLRFVVGLCLAGLYVVIESWLNDQAATANRGAVLSTYTLVHFGALTAGQFLLMVHDPAGFVLFGVAAILLGLALVPVASTRAVSPRQPEAVVLDIRRLWRLSPVGFVGCLTVGFVNGSFWSLGPVFASRSGLDVGNLVYFMAGATMAGALAQWPFGLLSDRIDRRFVIVAVAVGAAVVGALLGVWREPPPLPLIVLATAFGGFAIPLYAVAVAHTNDVAEGGEFVALAGGLLLLFGSGAALGPLAASALMAVAGPAGLFMLTSCAHVMLAAFTLLRIAVRPRRRGGERTGFVAVPRTSPTLYELDPRSDPAPPNRPPAPGQTSSM